MININLLPGEELTKMGAPGKFLAWVLTYGRYIIIGTEIIVLLVFLSRFKLDQELTDLHQSIKQKQAIVLGASNLEQQIRDLQTRLLFIKKLEQQRDTAPKLLSILENLTPPEVTLTDFYFNSTKFTLTATTLSNNSFTIFLNNLAASNSFTDISVDDVGKDPSSSQFKFQISAALKNL